MLGKMTILLIFENFLDGKIDGFDILTSQEPCEKDVPTAHGLRGISKSINRRGTRNHLKTH